MEVGKEFDEPNMCNELFNGCPYTYRQVLDMIARMRHTIREQGQSDEENVSRLLKWSEHYDLNNRLEDDTKTKKMKAKFEKQKKKLKEREENKKQNEQEETNSGNEEDQVKSFLV